MPHWPAPVLGNVFGNLLVVVGDALGVGGNVRLEELGLVAVVTLADFWSLAIS